MQTEPEHDTTKNGFVWNQHYHRSRPSILDTNPHRHLLTHGQRFEREKEIDIVHCVVFFISCCNDVALAKYLSSP